MLILALETSCDETAAALVKDGCRILAHEVASSLSLHAKTGGIIPETAARQQLTTIIPIISSVLKKGLNWLPKKSDPPTIDALAVTQGPGLIGSLLVGIETAQTLAQIWEKRIIPVNHLKAHLFANWLEKKPSQQPPLPAIGLVVSGGHTDLVKISKDKKITWLGGTRDDAAGECFDKTARLIGLSYPGGPAIQKIAQTNHRPLAGRLPQPMIDQKNPDFSFSGLKTAVANLVKKQSLPANLVAAEIQEAIAHVLVTKTLRLVQKHRPASLLLGGGVAANQRLINLFKEKIDQDHLRVNFYFPLPALCTDNAASIGAAAYHLSRNQSVTRLIAQPNLEIIQ